MFSEKDLMLKNLLKEILKKIFCCNIALLKLKAHIKHKIY